MLAGTVGNFINYNYPLSHFKPVEKDFDTNNVLKENDHILNCLIASCTVREAERLAFAENGHAMITPDIIKALRKGLISKIHQLRDKTFNP